jgi:predicted phosphodiesterase
VRRVALISDVHGNLVALDRVLADIDACGAAEVRCLGDLVGYGPDPAGVIARIRDRGIPTVRGNYDDGIGNSRGGCGCFYASQEAKDDGDASYRFTDGLLSSVEREYLASLPDGLRLEDTGDLSVLLVHGSPRKINEYLMPDRPDAQLVRLARSAGADVLVCGHVHIPYHKVLTDEDGRPVHVINAGSVGKPKDGDPRACWVELLLVDAGETRMPLADTLEPAGDGGTLVGTIAHRVVYPVEEVAARMLGAGLPDRLADALRTG